MKLKKRIVLTTIVSLLGLMIFVSSNFAAGNTEGSEKGIAHIVAELQNFFTELNQLVLSQQEEITLLKEIVVSQSNEISILQQTVIEQNSRINQFQDSMNNQSDSISTLINQVSSLQSQINELRDQSGHNPPSNEQVVTGKVTLEDGTPVVGAAVKLLDNGGFYSTSTDPNGMYTIRVHSFDAGTFHAIVAEKDYLIDLKTNITVSSGTPTVIDFVLVESGKIEGKITIVNGVIINYIYLYLTDGNGAKLNIAHIRPDGSYSFNAPDGTYNLLLVADGGRELTQGVTVVSGQTVNKDFAIKQ